MTVDFVNIGERIRYCRVKNNLTQEKLAELTDLSNVYISIIERGQRVPNLKAIILIANALNITADELLCDYLLVSEKQQGTASFDILFDCSVEEMAIISKCMKALKETLRGYKITK